MTSGETLTSKILLVDDWLPVLGPYLVVEPEDSGYLVGYAFAVLGWFAEAVLPLCV